MEGPEQDTPTHRTLQTGSETEVTLIRSSGGEGGHLQGFQCLWDPLGDGDILQISGTGDIGIKQRLARGCKELVPGEGGIQ